MAAARLTLRLALLVQLALSAGGTSAQAHANYVRSVPDADARLALPPAEVRVTFSESPEPRLSEVAVLTVDGKRVDKGDLARVDATTLKVELQPIGVGGYTVRWRTVSAVDGHETRGSFAFVIGNAELPTLPDLPVSPPPSSLEILARLLSYAGVALLVGIPFFARFIARRDADRSGSQRFARAGALALVAGTVMLLQETGGLGFIASSRIGLLLAGRAALGAAALVAPWTEATLLLGTVAAATLTLQSHAAALDDPLGIALDYAHVLAAGAWVGGLVALAFVALPRRASAGPAETRELGALIWRFSTLGLTAVVVIVATGTLQSLRRLLDPRDLIETPYGLALLAKIVLLAFAIALASLNLLRYGPRLRANLGGSRMKRLLDLGVRGEVVLVAAILVAASVLTALPPPNYATGAAYVGVQHADGLRLQLLVQSPNPGQNRFDVRLQEGFSAPTNVERVTIRFTMQEMDMGEQELAAQSKGAGEFVAAGSPTSMYGHWNLEVIVRRTGRADARALFRVPVEGGEGGIRTRIVTAGALNLIVYSEPATPVAGQPLTLVVLPTDQSGNPLHGAQLRAELEGQSYEGVADRGVQFRIELPAQSAGQKNIELVVRTAQRESRGTYDVTVAR